MHEGTIRYLKADAGYGFIRPSDGSSDVFFNFKQVLSPSTPRLEQRVSYDIGTSKDGRHRAERVRLL
ncbi:cold-shock protein [Bradyrhizobium sp. UFLA05-153]